MKYILPIIFVFLQSCLFFGSEESSSPKDTSIDSSSDTGVDLAKSTDAKDPDISKNEPDLPIDIGDGGMTKCVKNDECGENSVCSESLCVCEIGFERTNGGCRVGAITKNITRLITLIEDTSSRSVVLNFTASNYDQVVPFLSARSEGTDPSNSHVIPKNNDENIHFTRGGTGGAVNIGVNLVEFDERHIKVSNGTLEIEDGVRAIQEPVKAQPNNSFLVFYTSTVTENVGTDFNPIHTSVRGWVSDDKIEFTRKGERGKLTIRWYLVVSKGDAFQVSHENISIEGDQLYSSNVEELRNPMLLWSNQTIMQNYKEGHALCQYQPEAQNVRCSRGMRDRDAAEPAIQIALQKIYFQNPKLKTRHTEDDMDRKVRRNRKIPVGDNKATATAISGQLGSAGTVTLIPGANSDGGHPAMCSIILNDSNEFEIRRESEADTAVYALQYVNWY